MATRRRRRALRNNVDTVAALTDGAVAVRRTGRRAWRRSPGWSHSFRGTCSLTIYADSFVDRAAGLASGGPGSSSRLALGEHATYLAHGVSGRPLAVSKEGQIA